MHELAKRAKNELLQYCVSPEGWFYASGAQNKGQGNFHCLFGRDACITCLLLLEYMKATKKYDFLQLVKRTLEKLADTAGKRFNRLTGEKPGWIIHELRTDLYQHLTGREMQNSAWPIDEDGVMRIYESLDATPLYLIAVHRYLELADDAKWLESQLYAARNALKAIINFGDNNRDGLIDYTVPVERTCGGLAIQSWMDSTESLMGPIIYPVAPLEVQAYVWLAFRLWADLFRSRGQEHELSIKLDWYAQLLQLKVWNAFRTEDEGGAYLAGNLNGAGKLAQGASSNMGHLLWAVTGETVKEAEGVLGKIGKNLKRYQQVAERLVQPDLFTPKAGIRTLSSLAPHYDVKKYHNGAVWPHDNALIYLGLRRCGFSTQASMVARAVFSALEHFDAPGLELCFYNEEGYGEFKHSGGNPCNRVQAWALAGVLAMTAWEEQAGE